MNAIDTLLEELSIAKSFEEVRIMGYEEILAFPTSLLSREASAEVREALDWSMNRLHLINLALLALDALAVDTYPIRIQQVAAEKVIKELKEALEAMRIAVDEFEAPPEAILTVSEEILV